MSKTEETIQARVDEAKALLAECEVVQALQRRDWLIPTQEQLDLAHQTEAQRNFLRGCVAGLNYAIRRVREHEA